MINDLTRAVFHMILRSWIVYKLSWLNYNLCRKAIVTSIFIICLTTQTVFYIHTIIMKYIYIHFISKFDFQYFGTQTSLLFIFFKSKFSYENFRKYSKLPSSVLTHNLATHLFSSLSEKKLKLSVCLTKILLISAKMKLKLGNKANFSQTWKKELPA